MRLQVNDVIDSVLHELADNQGKWNMVFDLNSLKDLPTNLKWAVVRKAVKGGYSGGCSCGCRGDLEITDKGLARIGRERTKPYSGY